MLMSNIIIMITPDVNTNNSPACVGPLYKPRTICGPMDICVTLWAPVAPGLIDISRTKRFAACARMPRLPGSPHLTMCIYTYIHMCTHIYIYIYMCMCTHI